MVDFHVSATVTHMKQKFYAGEEFADGFYEDWPFYFSVGNSSASTEPCFVTGYMISIRASDIGPNVESDYVLVTKGMGGNIGERLTPGHGKTYSLKIKLKKDLADLMVANGTRAVKAVLTVEYLVGGSRKTAQDVFEDITILSGRYSPQILAFSTLRTESNIPTDDGIDIMAKMQLSYAPETELSMMDLRLHYAEGRDATVDDAYLLLNSKISTEEISFILSQQFPNSSDWGFLLYFGDKYENVVVPSHIFKAFANMHLSGAANGGVCFGGFSKSTFEHPMFECHYPAYFYGGIVQGGGGGYPAVGVEQDTGMKWIDGKPIYRQVLQITGTNKAGESLSVPLGSFKLGFLIRLDGGFFSGEDFCCFATAHNSTVGNNVYTRIRYATTAPEIRIVCGSARSIGSGYAIVEYTKAD